MKCLAACHGCSTRSDHRPGPHWAVCTGCNPASQAAHTPSQCTARLRGRHHSPPCTRCLGLPRAERRTTAHRRRHKIRSPCRPRTARRSRTLHTGRTSCTQPTMVLPVGTTASGRLGCRARTSLHTCHPRTTRTCPGAWTSKSCARTTASSRTPRSWRWRLCPRQAQGTPAPPPTLNRSGNRGAKPTETRSRGSARASAASRSRACAQRSDGRGRRSFEGASRGAARDEHEHEHSRTVRHSKGGCAASPSC